MTVRKRKKKKEKRKGWEFWWGSYRPGVGEEDEKYKDFENGKDERELQKLKRLNKWRCGSGRVRNLDQGRQD